MKHESLRYLFELLNNQFVSKVQVY